MNGEGARFHLWQAAILGSVSANLDLPTRVLCALVAEKAPAVLWVTDRDLRCTEVFGAESAGVGVRAEQVRGRTLFEFLGTEDEASPPVVAHRRALAGEEADYELTLRGRVFESHVAPLRDSAGRIVGCVGVARDVSAQREAEAAVRRARAGRVRSGAETPGDRTTSSFELEAICEGLADGVLIADIETTRVVRANAAMCQMLGYDEAELAGMEVTDLHPADEAPKVTRMLRSLPVGAARLSQDVPVRRKDGTVFYADVTDQVITYRRRTCGVALFHDVTHRKRAEEELRASEARYRELIENVNSIILRMDVHGRVTFFNRFAETFFGFAREEIVGRSVLGTIVPLEESSGRDLRKLVRHICRHPEKHVNNENENMRRDGSRVWVAWSNRPVRDAEGNVVEVMCVGNDITKRVEAEQQLHRDQRALRGMLQSQERERKLIAYEIHDGLAQLLAGAAMQLDLARPTAGRAPEGTPAPLATAQQLIGQSVAEARRLIRGLRPPELEESGVAAAVEQLARETAARGRIEVDLRIDGRLGRLDPLVENAVFRIVQESLTNAERYSQSGQVRLRLKACGDRLRIDVRDWGQGFDVKAVGRESFGLRGMRERARVLGGTASIRSAVGKGTHIAVDLPCRVAP